MKRVLMVICIIMAVVIACAATTIKNEKPECLCPDQDVYGVIMFPNGVKMMVYVPMGHFSNPDNYVPAKDLEEEPEHVVQLRRGNNVKEILRFNRSHCFSDSYL